MMETDVLSLFSASPAFDLVASENRAVGLDGILSINPFLWSGIASLPVW